MKVPHFAVVGHPNKGKSTLVSTLAHDENVNIGELPGTTEECSYFPMKADGRELYCLVDTPGFQRPNQFLEMLQIKSGTVQERPALIRQLIGQKETQERFPEECKLLTPIVQGSGILYVVDGSVPFTSEYEAEMEILRWTGQPKMAIINPIQSEQFVKDWRNALMQFFGIVKVVNVAYTPFNTRISLLRGFAELNQHWQQPLTEACTLLQQDIVAKRKQSARYIAASIIDTMLAKMSTKVPISEDDIDKHCRKLEGKFKQKISQEENSLRKKLDKLYGQTYAKIHSDSMELLDKDIFSAESIRLLGLSRLQLASAGLVSGATTGGAVDVALGGSSLLLGAITGAGIGAIAALWGTKSLTHVKVLNSPLGKKKISMRLSEDSQIPYMLLLRARLYWKILSERAHGNRKELSTEQFAALPSLQSKAREQVKQLLSQAGKGRDNMNIYLELTAVIDECLTRDEQTVLEKKDV